MRSTAINKVVSVLFFERSPGEIFMSDGISDHMGKGVVGSVAEWVKASFLRQS